MVEITDVDSATAWQKAQPHQVQVWFAVREALRALPALGRGRNEVKSGLAFASLRAVFIASAAASSADGQMKQFENAAQAAALFYHSLPSRTMSAADDFISSAADCARSVLQATEVVAGIRTSS